MRSAPAHVPTCTPLEATFEALPRYGYNTYALGVSRDGKIVAGFGENGSNLNGTALLWDESGSLQLLERPAGSEARDAFHAFAVSDPDPATGTRIVTGIGSLLQLGQRSYVRWIGGAFQDSGVSAPSPGFGATSLLWETPIDATSDGAMLVGQDTAPTSFQPFTLEPVSGDLEHLAAPGPGYGEASAVSDDGTIVAGDVFVEGPGCSGAGCRVPAFWNDGALGILDHNAACESANGRVLDLSADGSIAVGRVMDCSTGFFVHHPAIWREGKLTQISMTVLSDDPASRPAAISISPDGRLVAGTWNNTHGPAFVWDDELGLRDLEVLLARDHGLSDEMATWNLAAATGVTVLPDGRAVVVGYMWPADRVAGPGNYSAFRVTLEPSCPDDDRDGLCNEWEERGYVDVNCNGMLDEPGDLLLPDADPDRMNIYVEADMLEGTVIPDEAIADVESAFAAVPNSLIGNPGGERGIQLRIELDDPLLPPLGETWKFPSDCGMPPAFIALKDAWFGDALERSFPDVLRVKRRLFRYAIIGGAFDNDVEGVGMPFGPDFIVAVGNEAGRDYFAGQTMHEIGHTLGLDHGGPVNDQNYKPNYHSVMSYSWSTPAKVPIDGKLGIQRYARSWLLDYARTAFANDLDEPNGMDEAAGLGAPEGHGSHVVPVGPLEGSIVSLAARARLQPEQGPIDFDRDGIPNEMLSAPSNVNQVNPFDADDFGGPPQLERLEATDDWSYVASSYKSFFSHPNWAGAQSCAGFTTGGGLRELTREQIAGLSVDMPIDCNGNGIEDTDELEQGLASDDDGNALLDECEPVVGDCDGDDDVDLDDRDLLVAAFGRSEGEPEYLECADLDHDRDVTFVDYQAWVAAHEASQAAAARCGGVGGGEAAMLLGVWVWGRRRDAGRRPAGSGGGS